MPDTGAPYFIPFADPTDLVRDWPALSEDVAEQVALGLDAAGNAGIGSNVVQTAKTDTFTTSSSSFTTVTGLTATITPTSDASLVLVLFRVAGARTTGTNAAQVRLIRGATPIAVGAAEGSRTPATGLVAQSSASGFEVISGGFLDNPGTDSPVTYSIEMRVSDGSGSVFVNRSQNNNDLAANARMASTIILVEVAA